MLSANFTCLPHPSSFATQVCMMGKYHNVLYIGMKVAWEWGVADSDTIRELLG